VNSKGTRRFWELYAELPSHVKRLARKNYQLWKDNPSHPSLSFKRLKGGSGTRFSVRVGDHYRAIGQVFGDTIEWVWIGSHEEYNHIQG
jgi:hypothetical protein